MNEILKARDLMTEGCRCCDEGERIVDAARLMAELHVGALPICGADQKLHGMLTDRDIVVKCLAVGLDPNQCTCGELAGGEIIWVGEDAPVQEVLDKMETRMVRRLPVLDHDHKLVGIISQGDVARHLDFQASGHLVEAVSSGPLQE